MESLPSFLSSFPFVLQLKGQDLRLKGLNRIGNLLVPNNNYCLFEDWMMPILDQMYKEQEEQGRKGSTLPALDRLLWKNGTCCSSGVFCSLRCVPSVEPDTDCCCDCRSSLQASSGPRLSSSTDWGRRSITPSRFTTGATRMTSPSSALRLRTDLSGTCSTSTRTRHLASRSTSSRISRGLTTSPSGLRRGGPGSLSSEGVSPSTTCSMPTSCATAQTFAPSSALPPVSRLSTAVRMSSALHYIRAAAEFDGSDSGARPDEAISWGKIKMDAKPVKVYGDATILFPLLVSQTFAKHYSDRPRERLPVERA